MKVHTDLIFGDLQLLGYLAIGVSFDVSKTEDLVLRRRELCGKKEDVVQGVLGLQVGGKVFVTPVFDGFVRGGRDVGLCSGGGRLPHLVKGDVATDLSEPGRHVLDCGPLFPTLPCSNHRFLHHILCLSGVQRNAKGETIKTVSVGKDMGAQVQ